MRLVLIHGFVCDGRFWQPQAEYLAGLGHEVRAPDLPYHGGAGEGVARSLQGLAEWLARTHLRHPVVLVGHSLGGMIGLQVVRERPEVVRGLALVDSFPSLELNGRLLPGMFVKGQHEDVRRWVETTRAGILRRMTQEVHDEIWPSIQDFDARPRLVGIRCPVLGVYGGRGRYEPHETDRLRSDLGLDRTAGRSEVAIVADAGHFVNLEEPQRFNEVLGDWIARLEAG